MLLRYTAIGLVCGGLAAIGACSLDVRGGAFGEGSTDATGASSSSGAVGSSGGGSGGQQGSSGGGGSEPAGSSSSSGGNAGCGKPPGTLSGECMNRRAITIVADAAMNVPSVPANYSMALRFDHASDVQQGLSKADGSDVRVGRRKADGSWVEVDRVVDPGSSWNEATTTIWFKTDAPIAEGATDDRYALFLGCSASGLGSAPSADPSSVFLFWDDFESGLAKWVSAVQGYWEIAQDQHRSGSSSLRAGSNSGTDQWIAATGINTADVAVDAFLRLSHTGDKTDISMGARFDLMKPVTQLEVNYFGADGNWSLAESVNHAPWWTAYATTNKPPSVDTWFRVSLRVITRNAGEALTAAFVDGALVVPNGGGFVKWSTPTGAGSLGLVSWKIASNQWLWVDDVMVRKLVSPGPKVSANVLESCPFSD